MRTSATALVALGIFATLPVRADHTLTDLQNARALFAHAEADEASEEWALALAKLRGAASIKMTAGLRFHIAHCEEKLGKLVDALADYAAAETLARSERNHEVLEAIVEPVAALHVRIPTIKFAVPPEVATVQIHLDGAAVQESDWRTTILPIDPGSHRIDARAPGRVPFSWTLIALEHEATVLDVRLPVLPPMSPSARTSVGTGGVGPNHEAERANGRGGAIVATVGAMVLAGSGLGTYLVAGGAQSDARDECARAASCDDAKSKVRILDTLALTTWIAAAALGTFAIILWAQPSHASPTRTTRLTVSPALRGARLEGRF